MNTPEVFSFILLTAFISPVSLILVIFFLRSQDKSRKTFFFPSPNKLPHTEVNNINTYVSGVRAGALLKLIFQNVFPLLVQLQGGPPIRCFPAHDQSLCGLDSNWEGVGAADGGPESPGVRPAVGSFWSRASDQGLPGSSPPAWAPVAFLSAQSSVPAYGPPHVPFKGVPLEAKMQCPQR